MVPWLIIPRRVRDLEAKAKRGAVHYPRKLIALFTEAIHPPNREPNGEVSAEQLAQVRGRRSMGRLRRTGLAGLGRCRPTRRRPREHLWRHVYEWFTFLSHPEIAAAPSTGRESKRSGRLG